MQLLSIALNELKIIIIVKLFLKYALKKVYIWILKIFSQLKKYGKSLLKYVFLKIQVF